MLFMATQLLSLLGQGCKHGLQLQQLAAPDMPCQLLHFTIGMPCMQAATMVSTCLSPHYMRCGSADKNLLLTHM